MRNKIILALGIGVLIIGIIFYVFFYNEEVYGNDRESILSVIHSIEGYEENTITLLTWRDFGETRVVGFLSDGRPGYIEFSKNKDDNYTWRHIQTSHDGSFELFLPNLPATAGAHFMLVSNEESELAKMQVKVNGEVLEQAVTPFQPMVTWIKLPTSKDGHYTFRHYQYFDQHGGAIEP